MPPAAPDLPQPGGSGGGPSRAPRHLALFLFAMNLGGAQRRTLTLASAFAERGLRVDLVVVSGHGELVRELPSAVRLVVLHPGWRRAIATLEPHMRLRGIETFAGIPALAAYLRRERPEVLLSAASHANLVSILARRLSGVPVRLVLRASNDPSGYPELWPLGQRVIRSFLRWMAKRIYPWADAVIAVSRGVADDIIGLTQMPRERITTIYNPMPMTELCARAREPVAHPWLVTRDVPVVLGVGKLKIQKDFPTLIRAFARLRAQRPAKLVILGDGPQRGGLERLVQELGLGADVALPGYVANPFAWMARASVFVLSSAWEGLPGVLIEAMACGCPVVSTDCASGPAEILEDGVYGPLTPVRDDRALAGSIAAVLDSPPDPERLRARASEFSLEPAIDAYLDVLFPGGGLRSSTPPSATQ